MKSFIASTVFTLGLVGFINFAHAEDAKTTAAEHESHHVEAAPINAGDANKMDMESMMQDCMKMHKDHKMCHQESMKNCEAKMGKHECSKIMKNMKHMKMDKK